MEKGFIKLYRSLFSHWLWDDKPFARGQAWTDLIYLANYEDSQVLTKGKLIEIKRGQTLRSISFLSKRWGWSTKKVRGFLGLLEGQSMVTTEGTPEGTLITIENYTYFNDVGQADGNTNWQLEDTSEDKTEGTTEGEQRATINKKVKKVKKEKKGKNIYTPDTAERYGEFENVILADDEYTKLVEKFPMDYQERIESLSAYLKQTGRRYKSHYATILAWDRKDKKEEQERKQKQEGRMDWLDELERVHEMREADEVDMDEAGFPW